MSHTYRLHIWHFDIRGNLQESLIDAGDDVTIKLMNGRLNFSGPNIEMSYASEDLQEMTFERVEI